MSGAPGFTAEDLRGALATRTIGRDVRVLDDIDSTSSEARRIVERGEGVHGAAIVALRQTAGRGTGGKVWHSHDPVGLWSTTILEGEIAHPVSLMVGCAVVDAIRDLASGAVRPHLKWPNDVLIGEGVGGARKVSGILVETAFAPGATAPAFLVGIGINVLQTAFDGELALRATSLRMAGARVTVPEVFGALMGAVERHLADPEPVALRWIARTRMIDTGALIVRGAERAPITIRGLTPDGRLVVEHASGRRETLAAATDMDLIWPMS